MYVVSVALEAMCRRIYMALLSMVYINYLQHMLGEGWFLFY